MSYTYTVREDTLLIQEEEFIRDNWSEWFPGLGDSHDIFWDTDDGLFNSVYNNNFGRSEEEAIRDIKDELLPYASASFDSTKFFPMLSKLYNGWWNAKNEKLANENNDDDDKAAIQSKTLGAIVAMRRETKVAQEAEPDRGKQLSRLKSLYDDKGFTEDNQYYAQLVNDMNLTESDIINNPNAAETGDYKIPIPLSYHFKVPGGTKEGISSDIPTKLLTGNDKRDREHFKEYLSIIKRRQIDDWNWDSGNWNILGQEKRQLAADKWAKQNADALFDEYKEYVVEIVKDMEPQNIEKSLKRLEAKKNIGDLNKDLGI